MLDIIGFPGRFCRAAKGGGFCRGARSPGWGAIIPAKGNIEPAKDEKGYRGENEDFDDNIPF